jgi:hypothetical protein
METKRVGFLLGAGVSLACDAPTTDELTAALLGQDIPYERHSDGRYRPRAPGHGAPEVSLVQRVGPYLKCLERRVEAYYDGWAKEATRSARRVTYEDLAFLSVQVLETMNYDRDNPALMPFVLGLMEELQTTRDQLYETAEEALYLISDHVTAHLARLLPRAGHLACLREACRTLRNRVQTILSLNHDCLIEQVLREASIPVNDMLRTSPEGRQVLQVSLLPIR